MERILFVQNGELDEVNKLLSEGWKVKNIQCCGEPVSAYGYGYAGGESGRYDSEDGHYCGDICAYIVIQK